MALVQLQPLIPEAIYDLRYATSNNIVGEILYSDATAHLDEAAALQLAKATAAFSDHAVRPVIWDAYRTPEAHQKLRTKTNDNRYVLEASNHLKGLAVDMTLARTDGTYLEMGTDFDDFGPKAHIDTTLLTEQQAANRQLLHRVMIELGFEPWPYEWWHFDFMG